MHCTRAHSSDFAHLQEAWLALHGEGIPQARRSFLRSKARVKVLATVQFCSGSLERTVLELQGKEGFCL